MRATGTINRHGARPRLTSLVYAALTFRLLRSRVRMHRRWGRAMLSSRVGEEVSSRYFKTRDEFYRQRVEGRPDPALVGEWAILSWLKEIVDDA